MMTNTMTWLQNWWLLTKDDKDVAECFSNFLSPAVASLNLHCDPAHTFEVSEKLNSIDRCIQKYKKHPSIVFLNPQHAG